MVLPLPQADLSCPALGSVPLATVVTRKPFGLQYPNQVSLYLTAPLEKCAISDGSKHYPSEDFSTMSALGGPQLPGPLNTESPITHLGWEAATQRPMSRKAGLVRQLTNSNPWSSGLCRVQLASGTEERARQLCSLSSVMNPSGEKRSSSEPFTSLAHSATGMGMSTIATGKATECCTSQGRELEGHPITCTSLTGSESSDGSDLLKVTWLVGSTGTSEPSVSQGKEGQVERGPAWSRMEGRVDA